MKVFVNYTNWKGLREWREIEPETLGQFTMQVGRYPLQGNNEGNHEITLVMHVSMVDRGGVRRTLRVDHIHGFKVEN